MLNSNIAIFITGTIYPNSTGTEVLDPQSRKQEYIAALAFYMEILPYSIYFLENSNPQISEDPDFHALIQNGLNVTYVSVEQDYSRGKGFQEFQVLDQAIRNYGNQFEQIFKLTGRYRVKNSLTLIESFQNHHCNLMMDFHQKMKVGITSVFGVSVDFYNRHFFDIYKKVNDSEGYFIEHAIYDYISSHQLWSEAMLFPVNPSIEGISGSSGTSLMRNPVKMKIRNAERKILHLLDKKQFTIEY